MDRYDPYTDKFLRDTQYNILSTNLAEVGTGCSEFPNNSDAISRQAAIDALDKCHCGGKDENGRPWIYKENAVETIEMVEPSPSAQPEPPEECERCMMEHTDEMEKLEAELAMAQPHWIPVTERLPESKEEDLEYPMVLICFENEEIMLGCFYESTKEWGTGEYFDKKCDPIAWMPLPEPFKGVTT